MYSVILRIYFRGANKGSRNKVILVAWLRMGGEGRGGEGEGHFPEKVIRQKDIKFCFKIGFCSRRTSPNEMLSNLLLNI
jgi:hypothetical protein